RCRLFGERRAWDYKEHPGNMPYQPIENYGVIGNLHTVALVGINGSIDWLCLPRFDSPSVFAAILDDKKGGHFRIAPVPCVDLRPKQFYWPDTNILITRFLHAEGVGELEDYMPVGGAGGDAPDQIVRRVRVVRGQMPFRLECRPAFDYARAHYTTAPAECGVHFAGPGLSLGLASSVPLRIEGDGVTADFTLAQGQSAIFILRLLPAGRNLDFCPNPSDAELRFRETVGYWRRWLSRCSYQGRWREMVHRS